MRPDPPANGSPLDAVEATEPTLLPPNLPVRPRPVADPADDLSAETLDRDQA